MSWEKVEISIWRRLPVSEWSLRNDLGGKKMKAISWSWREKKRFPGRRKFGSKNSECQVCLTKSKINKKLSVIKLEEEKTRQDEEEVTGDLNKQVLISHWETLAYIIYTQLYIREMKVKTKTNIILCH